MESEKTLLLRHNKKLGKFLLYILFVDIVLLCLAGFFVSKLFIGVGAGIGITCGTVALRLFYPFKGGKNE